MNDKHISSAIIALAATNLLCTSVLIGAIHNTYLKVEAATQQLNYIYNQVSEINEKTYLTENIGATASVVDYPEQNTTSYDIPAYDTSFKTYMDYRCITNENSDQYKLQQLAWTDEDGLRRLGNAYLVAMGTYYTEECGKVFEIEFDTGEIITVVVGDIKADSHTDINNQYSPVYDNEGNMISANVLEFIVDTQEMARKAKRLGSVEICANLQGNIKSITAVDAERELYWYY